MLQPKTLKIVKITEEDGDIYGKLSETSYSLIEREWKVYHSDVPFEVGTEVIEVRGGYWPKVKPYP